MLATCHRAYVGNEVQELVYNRLVGRQQRLVLLADSSRCYVLEAD
jgi:hypothetical protein